MSKATDEGQYAVRDAIQALTAKIPSLMVASRVAVTTTGSITTSSVQVVGANANRLGFILWNNSANSAYITLGATSSSATPTFILATFASLTWVYPIAYTGPIAAIRNAGSGSITCYELIA